MAFDPGDARPDLPTSLIGLASRAWQRRWPVVAISHHAKIGYLPVPKAGNTAILTALTRIEERAGIDPSRSDPRTGEPTPLEWLRPTSRAAWSRVLAFNRGYQWMTIVRNPWHRLVSCYMDKVRGSFQGAESARSEVYDGLTRYNRMLRRDLFHPDMSFEEFARLVCRIPDGVADPHFCSQYRRFMTPSGDLIANVILRLEDGNLLDRFFAYHLGEERLPRIRQTASAEWREFYTPELARRVGARYRRDVKMLGYEF